ncbi:MAG: hypothetical protein EYC70_06750 [Planctomycetota bacterium]|nr:MAG: hypothetical protein EYC70_06750 [Planctomycetota bacterium]
MRLILFAICASFLLGTNVRLGAQTIFVVDGKDPLATPTGPIFESISAAAANSGAQPGDVIRVKGMTSIGQPPLSLGYSENHYFSSGHAGESFPIRVPAGVTVEADSTTPPVYVYSTNSGLVEPLFRMLEPASGQTRTSTLRGLFLTGGPYGVKLDSVNDGSILQLVLDGITTSWCQVGVHVFAKNRAYVGLTATNCKIRDLQPIFGSETGTPALRTAVTGFFLDATEETAPNPGRVGALFQDLSVTGNFIGTAQLDSSSVIYAVAKGLTQEHSGLLSGMFVPPEPIANVHVIVSGGTLRGRQSLSPDTQGWNYGIRFESYETFGGGVLPDYVASANVKLTGTVVQNFRKYGVHGKLGFNARGKLTLNGGTVIEGTASSSGGEGTGVYLEANGHYMQLSGDGAIIRNNGQDGIHLFDLGTKPGNIIYPVGLYTGLTSCQIYGNGGNGITFQTSAVNNTAIVGGAWAYRAVINTKQLLYAPTSEHPQGLGFVDSCTIHNNGKKGVLFKLFGSSGTAGQENAGAVRFVNTFFWNNVEEAIFAELNEWSMLLAPFVHCTIAGNGDAVNSQVNMSFANPSQVYFQWSEVDPGGTTLYAYTKFFDSILERKSSGDPNFGSSVLSSKLVFDNGIPPYSPSLLYAAGLRTNASERLAKFSLDAYATSEPAPFEGPIMWTGLDPGRFYLNSQASAYDPHFDKTPAYLGGMSIPEAEYDIVGTNRPALSTNERDKGGQQAD